MRLKDFSNYQLAYLVLRIVASIYSNGGISCGRSTNSVLLDSVFALMSKKDKLQGKKISDLNFINIDGIKTIELENEVRRRIKNFKVEISDQLESGELSLLSNHSLIKQLLVHLNQFQLFYEEIPPEKLCVQAVTLLLTGNRQVNLFNRGDVVEEARNREYEYGHYHRHNLCEFCSYALDHDEIGFDPEDFEGDDEDDEPYF